MAGPFPGMDPFIEAQGSWLDFHNRLIAAICDKLGDDLPGDYVARVDERIELVDRGEDGASFLPDVLVAAPSSTEEVPSMMVSGLPVAATLNEVLYRDPEEVRHTWVEVRRLPDLELITVVEVLSPVNKSGSGRAAYLEKRDKYHAGRVNLVEIDLLLGGAPLPMKRPLGRGRYHAIVTRGPRLPTAEVYSWSVFDAVPTVPVPLRPPDADVPIEVAPLVDRVHTSGRYALTLKYDRKLPDDLPLDEAARAWSQAFLAARQAGDP